MRRVFIGSLVLWFVAILSQPVFSEVEANLPASVTIEELSKNPQKYLNKNITIEGNLVLEGHWYINPNYYLKKGDYKIAVNPWVPINVMECPPLIIQCNRPASMWEYIDKYLVLGGHLEQKENNYIFTVTNAPSKIFCPLSMIVEATGKLTIVTYSAIATSPIDPNLVVSYDPPSDSEFPIGTTTVTVTAIDDLMNKSQCFFEITVKPAKGDLNGDGEISPQDALIAFQCYLGLDFCLDDADVNQDGSVTPADALCLFKKYLGQPSCLDYGTGAVPVF